MQRRRSSGAVGRSPVRRSLGTQHRGPVAATAPSIFAQASYFRSFSLRVSLGSEDRRNMPRNVRTRCYPETEFGGFADIDGTLAFYRRVNALLTPDSVVLDVGCGRGEYRDDPIPIRRDARILRGK